MSVKSLICYLGTVLLTFLAPLVLAENLQSGVIVFHNINFDTNEHDIDENFYSTLDHNIDTLLNNNNVVIKIIGHTDSVGNEKNNKILSLKRAEAVKKYLVKRRVFADRIAIEGYGEKYPIASNRTMAGRAQNRRIEIHYWYIVPRKN